MKQGNTEFERWRRYMIESRSISLTAVADLHDDMQGYMPVSIAIGPNYELCLLLTKERPPLIQGMFPQTVTDTPYDYKVIILQKGGKRVLHFPDERWNYHFVQPIDEGHVLLAGARSVYRSEDDIERNGRVFSMDNKCIRSFCLGDGIQDLYVARDRTIWTSYFDEGVYGNFGWVEPIGSKGLIRWDADGRQLEWHDGSTGYFIDDCYALNVISADEVWFYFYMDFKIGVRKNGKTDYYTPDIEGSSMFAVYGDTLLMNGGYGDRDRFYELERDGLSYKTVRSVEFLKPDGKRLTPQATSNRGSRMLFLDGSELFLFNMAEHGFHSS